MNRTLIFNFKQCRTKRPAAIVASPALPRFLGIMLLIAGTESLLMFLLPLLHLSRNWSALLDTFTLSVLVAPSIYRMVTLDKMVEAQESHLQIYKQLVDVTLQGIMVTDSKMAILSVNGGFVRTTGYSEAEVLGKTPRILQSGKQGQEFYKTMRQSVFRTGQWEGEIWNKKKDGTIYAEWLNISSIQDSDGRVRNYVGVFSDITEHKMLEQRLKDENKELLNLSNTDSLTGIANRRFFDPVLAREWRRGQRTVTPLSIILIDIDCFKNYNDLFGHMTGDACLKAIARTLDAVVKRPADVIARYGGEEFIALLPNTDGPGAAELAEHLRKSVERLRIPHPTCATGDVVTISLGTATMVPSSAASAEQLVGWADQALYTAKRFGRNRVVVHSNDD